MPAFDKLALTAGNAKDGGYVTLAFADNGKLAGKNEPVALAIIKVAPPLFRGEIDVIYPPSPFDEKLTLRHKGDFAGRPDDYIFEWMTMPPLPDGSIPPSPSVADNNARWTIFSPNPSSGQGGIDIQIGGSSLFTLSDNWFVCRYRPSAANPFLGTNQWSEWTDPQLAEGWIKRVMKKINPFEQRFGAYRTNHVQNTITSRLSEAGPRWEGAIPLNVNNPDKYGLIEIYETVFKRGMMLSINGTPPISAGGANDALLLAASRLADLYMLMGNEGYGDAADPTISFGAEGHDFGDDATSVHCFQGQTASLLEEELALLRGRNYENKTPTWNPPVYNRLFWNFAKDGVAGGEAAYVLNYSITDLNHDGVIDEADAKIAYPQGHGDAWGHYLTAIKYYYDLLRNSHFDWVPRSEAISLGGQPMAVDYFDERKFASAAAAKARTGAEIVNLTYRSKYVEDPNGQWQGYKDGDKSVAWGFSEWAQRAGQGAYMDWVVGNALLLDNDTNHTGIQKIDRATVTDLSEIVGGFVNIQQQLDLADRGVNPLGVAKDALPFDISPAQVDQGKTHYEQIYDRAVQAMNNAIAVFTYAHDNAQALGRQADTVEEFARTVDQQENDYNNRLIEVYGYPYEDDIGTGKTYPQGYSGPDVYHYMYYDPTEVLGLPSYNQREYTIKALEHDLVSSADSPVLHELKLNLSTDGFGFVKPKEWKKPRRAPGEIQNAHSDLIQTLGRFKKSLTDYSNILDQENDQRGVISSILRSKDARLEANDLQINIYRQAQQQQTDLNTEIKAARDKQLTWQNRAAYVNIAANAIADGLPKFIIVGTANGGDPSFQARAAIRTSAAVASQLLNEQSQEQSLKELEHQQAKEDVQAQANIKVTISQKGTIIAESDSSVASAREQLQQMIRSEASQRLEIFTLQETMEQAASHYLSVLAKAQRIEEERIRFRNQTSTKVQEYRYRDLAFRIFRNDALQKYRAQYDLAARYVFLAAKAYDYETGLLSDDPANGQQFLMAIVKSRSLGKIANNIPQTAGSGDPGLADPMARMLANWSSFKPQVGFNNPRPLSTDFSLRRELFRIAPGVQGDVAWRRILKNSVVNNLMNMPEFRRYCKPFADFSIQPGIVIPFTTCIEPAQNFFGFSLAGGDHDYSTTYSTTKIRNNSVVFNNYYNGPGGLSSTPLVYLVPVGDDILRSPTKGLQAIRSWKVIDQKLPLPFPTGIINKQVVVQSDYIPVINSLQVSDGFLGDIRMFDGFRANHDAEPCVNNCSDSGLIGRSVWNTRWLLIIPGHQLRGDPDQGISIFINGKSGDDGISDIHLRFDTYSY